MLYYIPKSIKKGLIQIVKLHQTIASYMAKADNFDTMKPFVGNRKHWFSNRKHRYESLAKVYHIAITHGVGLRFVKRCTLLLPSAISNMIYKLLINVAISVLSLPRSWSVMSIAGWKMLKFPSK